MALQAKVGSFALNTSTGNQSVTGVGFQAKAYIFFVTNRTADGAAANATIIFGFATSSTSRATQSFRGFDASAPTDGNKSVTGTKCLTMANSSDAIIMEADFVSMDSDGLTINITTSDGVAYVVNYIALGGSDITNVAIKAFNTRTTTGTQNVTGVGFQPDMALIMTSSASADPVSNNSVLGGFGWASSASSRAARGIRIGSTVGTQVNEQKQLTTKVIEETNGGAVFMSADFSGFTSDGFDLNYTTVSGTARKCYALCIKGGKFKTGTFNQPTSTGNDSITGIGFAPVAVMLMSWNTTSSTSIVEDHKLSFGAATSSSERAMVWSGDQDNVSTQQSNSVLEQDNVMGMYSHADTPTTDALADFVSKNSDGFTLNWTTADATAREIPYFVFGSSSVKTVDGLAKASVKTINGLAVASVKTFNGLAY